MSAGMLSVIFVWLVAAIGDCDYEKTTTRNMDIISGLGCSRMYLTYIICGFL